MRAAGTEKGREKWISFGLAHDSFSLSPGLLRKRKPPARLTDRPFCLYHVPDPTCLDLRKSLPNSTLSSICQPRLHCTTIDLAPSTSPLPPPQHSQHPRPSKVNGPHAETRDPTQIRTRALTPSTRAPDCPVFALPTAATSSQPIFICLRQIFASPACSLAICTGTPASDPPLSLPA